MSLSLPVGASLRMGDYRIESVLGKGGFGITYRAFETRLERFVAIKEFAIPGCRREETRLLPAEEWPAEQYSEHKKRFLLEGRRLARLSHSGIISIYSIFEENDTVYLVMEFIEGQTLRDFTASQGGRLTVDQALAIIRRVGETLSFVHANGLLHRDLKPANLMLRPDGSLVLIDFGSAREFGIGIARLTAMLTPGYAPIEQYSEVGEFGPPTDVYALAAMTYNLTTGKTPINALSRKAGISLPTPKALNPDIPEWLSGAVMQGLAMDVAARPPTVREFLNLLESEGARRGHFARHTLVPDRPFVPQNAQQLCDTFKTNPTFEPDGNDRAGTLRLPLNIGNLDGHEDVVRALSWSCDGRRLISAAADQTVRIWDTSRRCQLALMEGHVSEVSCVAWRPGRDHAASGGCYSNILIWDCKTGAALTSLIGHTKSLTDVQWSPDGALLASAGVDGTVRVWDEENRQLRTTFTGHVGRVVSVAWQPSGRLLASVGDEQIVWLWSLDAQGAYRHLQGEMSATSCIAWRPDGRKLAVGALNAGLVWMWDINDCRLDSTLEIDFNTGSAGVCSMAWSPNGERIAIGCVDGIVHIWDAADETPAAVIRHETAMAVTVAWSPDGGVLATSAEGGRIRLWDVS